MQISSVNKFMLPGRYEKNENKKNKTGFIQVKCEFNPKWVLRNWLSNWLEHICWCNMIKFTLHSVYAYIFWCEYVIFNFEKLFDSSRQAICSSENEISNFLFVSFGRMTDVIKLQFKLQWSFEK